MSQNSSGLFLTQSQELELLENVGLDDNTIMTLLVDNANNTNNSQQQQQQLHQSYGLVYDHQESYQLSNPQQLQHNDVLYPLPDLLRPAPAVAPSVISNEDYEGPYKFEVYIDPHGSKNPWVYSSILNKLFINVFSPFPIDFKWDHQVKNLYVRATPIFSLPQHVQELVTRCIPHTQASQDSNRNVPEVLWDHVIRCQSPNAEYYGDKEQKRHLNVLVPLGIPQTGMDTVRLMYSFMCQNSCPSGMNRKPFEVVFTLEDDGGTIYGRRKLNVRVCSCPKRDKEKEEKDFMKDTESNGAPPHGKKRKMTDKVEKKPLVNAPLDTKEFTAQLTVCGKENLKQVIKYAYNLMAGEILTHGQNPHLKKCADSLAKQLKDLE